MNHTRAAKLIPAIFTAALMIMTSSCGKKAKTPYSSPKPQETEKRLTVGFSIDTLAIERWQRDLDVFMASVRDNDADVIVQNAGNSIEEQKRQLMYLANRNVDIIVVLPKNAESLTEEIEKIRSKNIPVISYDRLVRNTKVDLYITINSTLVGKMMAQEMQKIAGTKNWLLMLGPQEDYNMTLIQNGIYSALINPKKIISEVFFTEGWDYDLSRKKMIDIMTSGKIPDAIICGNDAIADSVLSVLKVYRPGKHIPICGQDADIAACQNIVRGYQDFTIYKPITLLAQTAAQYAVRIASGEKVENLVAPGSTIHNGDSPIPAIMLDTKVVKKENMEDVIIESGFHTYNEVYQDE